MTPPDLRIPTTTNLADAAVGYAAADLRVFPLWYLKPAQSKAGEGGGQGDVRLTCGCGKDPCPSKPGKHPLSLEGGPLRGATDASCDLRQVSGWWKRWPDANVGLTLHGLLVVDIDGPAGEQVYEVVAAELRLPQTLQAQSGRGRHLFFRLPENCPRVKSGTGLVWDAPTRRFGTGGKGLDIKTGDGSYMVVAPSLHANGKRYTWDNPTTPIAVLTLEQATALGRADAPKPPPGPSGPGGRRPDGDGAQDTMRRRVLAYVGRVCDTFGEVGQGERHKQLLATARTLGGYLHYGVVNQEEMVAALDAAATRNGAIEDKSYRRTVRDGFADGAQAPRYLEDKDDYRSNSAGQSGRAAGQSSRQEGQPRDERPAALAHLTVVVAGAEFSFEPGALAEQVVGLHHYVAALADCWPVHEAEIRELFATLAIQRAVRTEAKELLRLVERAAKANAEEAERQRRDSEPVGSSTGLRALTDIGNGERFMVRNASIARFCAGEWLIWGGKIWNPDPHGTQARRLAQLTVAEIETEVVTIGGDDEEAEGIRKRIRQHAKKSADSGRVSAMMREGAAMPGMAVAPSDLDAKPYLYVAANCAIEIGKEITVRDHDPRDLCTRASALNYREDAECPQFLTFLLWAMCGDHEMVRYLQRAIGYSLTGDVSEQCFFFLYGATGGNGKGTLLNVLQSVLGTYAVSMPATLIVEQRNGPQHPTELYRLRGARAAVGSDLLGERDSWNQPRLKSLTGSDVIAARKMGGDFVDMQPTWKLWLSANHKPIVRGGDMALWRRVHLIPFLNQPERPDPYLLERLMGEAEGILAWAVQGAREWFNGGLCAPEAVRNAVREYEEESDTLGMFISECCDVGASYSASADDVRDAYKAWCRRMDLPPMSQPTLYSRLTERGYVSQKDFRGNRTRQGIQVRASAKRASWSGAGPYGEDW